MKTSNKILNTAIGVVIISVSISLLILLITAIAQDEIGASSSSNITNMALMLSLLSLTSISYNELSKRKKFIIYKKVLKRRKNNMAIIDMLQSYVGKKITITTITDVNSGTLSSVSDGFIKLDVIKKGEVVGSKFIREDMITEISVILDRK